MNAEDACVCGCFWHAFCRFLEMAAVDNGFLMEASFFVLLLLKKQIDGHKRRQHRFWVREIFQRRNGYCVFYTLMQELRLGDSEYFFR